MKHLSLIGMPGVGKSSLGVILAKELGMQFVDVDLEIQKREGRLLREILEQDGVDGFLEIEECVLCALSPDEPSVIATGGSAVYSETAMMHLHKMGRIIYLQLPYDQLEKRLDNLAGRGVVLREGQTLRDLYEERSPLYAQYADLQIDESGLDMEETLRALLQALQEHFPEEN